MTRSSPMFQVQLAQVQRLWRKWRRVHAERVLGERRLLLLGAVAVTWFLLDTVLLTPSLARFKLASARYGKANGELVAKQEEQRRFNSDMVAITAQLKSEVEHLRQDVTKQKSDIDAFRGGLVPARDMRALLQAVLSGHGDVQLLSMKTMAPDEVRKQSPGVKDVSGLYRHGLELRLAGRFHALVRWLSSLEEWPRKVLWSGMTLETDEQGKLVLTVTLFTLSPDADPLEIATP